MTTFAKKGLYHSDLTRHGPMVVSLKGDPRDSKYQGKPPYIYFQVQGDEQEYSYNVENQAIRDILTRAPKNVWINFEAHGSREAATVAISEAEGSPVYQEPPQSAQQPVSPFGGEMVDRSVEFTARAVSGLKSHDLLLGPDAVQAIFSTIYIAETKR